MLIRWGLQRPYAASICSGLQACLGREKKLCCNSFSASAFGAVKQISLLSFLRVQDSELVRRDTAPQFWNWKSFTTFFEYSVPTYPTTYHRDVATLSRAETRWLVVGYVIVTSVYVFSGETPNTHLAKRARDLAFLRSIAKRSIAVSVQAIYTLGITLVLLFLLEEIFLLARCCCSCSYSSLQSWPLFSLRVL